MIKINQHQTANKFLNIKHYNKYKKNINLISDFLKTNNKNKKQTFI